MISKGANVKPSYLSKRVAGIKPSGIRRFFDIAATMDDVISLSIGEPDFTTPQPILDAGVRSLQAGETHYTSNAGKLELRDLQTRHLEKLYGVRYDPKTEIMFSVGASEALHLAIVALIEEGDEVIIPTPGFVSYAGIVSLAGGVPVEVPCKMENNFDLDPQDIEDAITSQTKIILLNFPCNPTGAVASRETLLKVAELAKQHDLIVISDEIYDQLVYGVEHVCFPTLPDMRDRTVLLGGYSKNYAMTGWRIGYAAGPAEIINGMLRIHQYIIMCINTTAQDAAIAALKEGEEYVAEMRESYNRRRKLIVDGMNRIGLPTCVPRGAFYAFPKISDTGLDSETFAERLLMEEHVAVVPGSAFGLGGEGFVRCCYATAYGQIEEALSRIQRFINRL
jgi:aminotransferase